MFSNKKVFPVVKEFGPEAERVIIHTLSEIYSSDNGYYIDFDDKAINGIAVRMGNTSSNDFIEEVINALVLKEYFNKELFVESSVLTSEEIQRRWHIATKRRHIDHTDLPYFILDRAKKIRHEYAMKLLATQFKKAFKVELKESQIAQIDARLDDLKRKAPEYGSAEVLLMVAIRRMMDCKYVNPSRFYYKGIFGEDQYLLRPTAKEEESKKDYVQAIKSKMSGQNKTKVTPPALKKV